MSRRIYLVVCRADIEALVAQGALSVDGRTAYAVTSDLRLRNPEVTDEEDLEYLAYAQAVAAAEPPRLVLAADVDDEPSPDAGAGAAVTVQGSLPMTGVASVHVGDDATADPLDDGLLWYDATELADVLAQLS